MFLSGDVIDYVTSNWPIVIGLGLFAYWYYRPANFPRGPRGFPVIGTIPYWGKHPEQVINNWAKKYGQVFSVRIGQEDWLILNNYDSMHEAFVKNYEEFSGKPIIPLLNDASKGCGMLFLDYSQAWIDQRKFCCATLYQSCKDPLGMELKFNEEAKHLIKCINEKKNKPSDLSYMLVRSAVNNIFSVTAGKRFQYDNPLLIQLLTALHENSCHPKISPKLSLLSVVPITRFIPPLRAAREKYLKNTRLISKVIQALIDDHKSDFDPDNTKDFMDCFLLKMKNKEAPSFTNLQLVQFLRDTLSGGVQNIAATILWGIVCFLHYPETQVKLYQEIKKVVGSDKDADMSMKLNLPYTSAFVQELLRFKTMVYLNSPHMNNKDVVFRGFNIPKKTKIFSNLWAVHNDPNIWKDPHVFNPDRHLNKQGEFIKSKYVIPFSIGPRLCIGERLARTSIFLNIVALVQNFEFLPDPSKLNLPDINGGCHAGIYVPDLFTVIAKNRNMP